MKIFKQDEYTVAQDDKEDVFVVEKDNSFYKMDKKTFNSFFNKSDLKYIRTDKDNILYMLGMLATIIVTLCLYFNIINYTIIDTNFWGATIILVGNILIHEIGHILFLKIFYKQSHIRIGFKFIFIWPAFYVDTSYSYMVPKYKKASIFLAGNFMNCLFILCVILGRPQLLPYCYLVISNILVNFVPIMKCDGYYVAMTLLNKTNKDKGKVSTTMEEFLRGFLMFIILGIISYFST